ncbi:MAG: histidine kinase, partial [Prevotella sp.]|nr:histidine kinase [Prevotella sp.]
FDKMQPNMKLAFLNNYGNLQYFKKDYAKALVVFQKMDSLVGALDCRGGFEDYLCKLNMADVLLNLGKTEESLVSLEPADSFFRANNIGDAIYYANTIRIGNALRKKDMATISHIIANEPKGLTADENMIDIRDHYFYDYYAKKNDMAKANYYQQRYTNRKDSLDRSREHMRASDIMMRLTMDTLTLHNQLRMEEKNAVIEKNKLIFTIVIGGILLAALVLLAWTLFLRKRNVDKQLEIVNLKIANTRSSIAPHFIFNVLNHAISNDKQNTDKAINGIIDLMHSQLTITKQMFVTLGEELNFAERYVEVATPTMGEDFKFTITKPNEDILQGRLVPSTFIQILAENSIKHGLRGLDREKELHVDVSITPEDTIIEVRDNGRGFDIRRSSNGTGTGLSVISRTIALYNERHRHKIKFTIENMTDKGGNLNGCKAILSVPSGLGH